MAERIEPGDARSALSEIDRRREQVIRRVAIPDWYWWVLSVLTIAIAAGTESHNGILLWTAVALFAAGVLASTARALLHGLTAPPRREWAEPVSGTLVLVRLAIFAAVVIGATLAVELPLKAAHVTYAGTFGTVAAAVPLVIGGPILTRRLGGFTRGWRSGSRG
jgi:hypothetical protein